ncbi:MAG: CDP-glycerol glycerophosphotransferase family protein [Verrucomicrobia bacterium]|nr:CDP-glycerol glycerophosphotransferase family protein [Verrucomicrobiota bacterium]MBS0647185.1 CDP-glycerol glycerophosphotransferase family protein [Verrucomicrobiota bacterium]
MGSRIAICPGPRTGLLDHLVPLCSLLKMPLVVQDPWVQAAAEIFYPPIQIELAEQQLQSLLDPYHILYTFESCRLYPGAHRFGQEVYHGPQLSVCGVHGNSDKFREDYWAEQYANEDIVLLYGEHMRACFDKKGVLERVKKWVRVGNFRYAYYLKHREFFDQKVQSLLPAAKGRWRLLYAPTWSFPPAQGPQDSPFFEQMQKIFQVPSTIQLIVKLHPFMYRLFPELLQQLREKYQTDQIVFLDEIPLVYPLLTQVDAYLGDYSSVGYDFLTTNKPLFLLTEGPLTQAGVFIPNLDLLYPTILQTQDCGHHNRQQIYDYTFGEPVPLDVLEEVLP